MNDFHYESIPNQDDRGSSAFLFDLRNSTIILRRISWDPRLPKHIEFMMKLHKKVYETLYNNCDPDKFAMNDTGDGYLCVFWDKLHALTCLDVAVRIQEFLESNLPRHNEALGLKDDIAKFDYGFAIHSGGSTIIVKNQTIKTYGHKIQCLKNNQMISPKYYVQDYNRTTYIKDVKIIYKNFIFGIVANTVARLESFTKNYIDFKFLVTGNYKKTYLEQAKGLKQAENKDIINLFKRPYVRKSLGRVNIKDGKENSNIGHKGHIVYVLSTDFIAKFKEYYVR